MQQQERDMDTPCRQGDEQATAHLPDAEEAGGQTLLEDKAANGTLTRQRPLCGAPAIRCQRVLTHPIQRLPTELLGMIFIATVQLVYHGVDELHILFEDNAVLPIQTAPYRLALVCRRWRDVALLTQDIWRFISVDIASMTSITGRLYEMYLKTAFERAGKRNVSLAVHKQARIGFVDGPTRATQYQYYDTLRPLLTQMARSDGISALNAFSCADFLDVAWPCTSLVRLEDGDVCTPVFLPSLATTAPNLRFVALHLSAFSNVPPGVAHPGVEDVNVLSSLRLGPAVNRYPLQCAFDFFPNARTFEFHLLLGVPTAALLQHDHVQTLRFSTIDTFNRLADEYMFPQLRTVVADWPPVSDDPLSFRPVLHLVAQCANLRVLEVNGYTTMEKEFAAALRGTPHLETLRCRSALPDDDFFAELAREPDWTCPDLALLHIAGVYEDALAEKIIDLVSRRKAAHAVAELTVWSVVHTELSASVGARLQAVLRSPDIF